ncbi:hypothetical protein GH714_010667 [Hevea brasiliensis]|uniref:Agglutinin domain-containing protein n=1 Tax=Hevea brasiliensis TaxID=3981 RepID=A0A6A6KQJ8_HEVBR|nr:hypothetical protein GH714_010667 [Hevea brasiliensis]
MAHQLERFIVIKSVFSGQHAYRMNETEAVACSEVSVFSPLVKIEVETAKINSKYVHLRFCRSNRYWAKTANDVWMIASSKQPVEETSNRSCTLFEPSIGKDGHHYLRHVQTGRRVRTSYRNEVSDKSYRVFVDDIDGGDSTPWYAFTFVDWETIVKLPKQVIFKGDNGKYLKTVTIEGNPFLQFSSDDPKDEASFHEVTMTPDGHVHIRATSSGLFWTLVPNWIWDYEIDPNRLEALFWPVKVNEHAIALRNERNHRFCKSLTAEGKTNCLNAAVNTVTDEAILQVAEPILRRKIYDVRYRLEDARILSDEVPISAGSGYAANTSNQKATLTVKVAYQEETTSSFSNSVSIMTGLGVEFKAGIPFLAEGKITVSAELTNTLEWNTTKKKLKQQR